MDKQDLDNHFFWNNRERFRSEGAVGIAILMERTGVSKSQLAALLGKPKSFISKILSGYHNFTFDTFADVCAVLGACSHHHFSYDFAVRAPSEDVELHARSLPFSNSNDSSDAFGNLTVATEAA